MVIDILVFIVSVVKVECQYILNKPVLAESFLPEQMFEDISKPREIVKDFLTSMINADSNKYNREIKHTTMYCQSLHTCYKCTKNIMHPCGWCHDYGCTDNTEMFCPKQNDVDNLTENIDPCPKIKHKGPILVPAGVKTNLQVELYAPDPIMYDKEIICQIKLRNKLVHVKGIILNDIVVCYPVLLDVSRHGEVETGAFKLIWGGAEPFSNEIPITIYKCEDMAMECKTCMSLPKEYGCGWCEKLESCVRNEKCGTYYMKWATNKLGCEPNKNKLYFV